VEDFALLGNAAAVPIIMAITQLLKKNFSFRYKADVVSFVVALVICPLWWFYNTPELEIVDALNDGTVASIKFVMTQIMIGIATWLSATKSYDLLSGNKKRADKHAGEIEKIQTHNETLSAHITELENGSGSGGNYESEVDVGDDEKLLEILEGR